MTQSARHLLILRLIEPWEPSDSKGRLRRPVDRALYPDAPAPSPTGPAVVMPGRCGPNLPHGGARAFIRVVVLCLGLVGATPASSKGAWVLWSQSTVDGRTDYTRIDSFPKNVPGRPQVICARWARAFSEKPEFKDKTFICLPDTVDPRGPKAK